MYKLTAAELIDRISDGNEQVRAAICKVIGKLDYETALNYIQESTLRDIGHRLNDKKVRSRTSHETALTPGPGAE
jgi:sister-chromatid-cohesion protein PDS5